MSGVDSQWAQLLADAISVLGNKEFFPRLAQALTTSSGTGNTLLFHYPPDSQPRAIYTCYPEGSDEYARHIDRYLSGPYILDPFYEASQRNIPAGAYQLQDIAPDDFTSSEFYRVYYKETGLKDEISFMQSLGEAGHLEFSVGYVGAEPAFPQEQVEFFKAIAPIVNSLVLRQWNFLDSGEYQNRKRRFTTNCNWRWTFLAARSSPSENNPFSSCYFRDIRTNLQQTSSPSLNPL